MTWKRDELGNWFESGGDGVIIRILIICVCVAAFYVGMIVRDSKWETELRSRGLRVYNSRTGALEWVDERTQQLDDK